jgi:hypothetical protein
MIDGLDLVIRQTLVADIPELANRLGFQPPDETWRQRVGAGTGVWLNCALVDLREDRHRRATGATIQREPPPLRRVRPPFLMRCHYLLSAWNSAKNSAAVPASEQEHRLLGRVVGALAQRAPLTPSSVLLPAELAGLPTAWQEAALDTDVLEAEGFPKIAEYWGTMGRTAPWRPVVWLVVTVPIVPDPTVVDGIVTTVLSTLGRGPALEAAEVVASVGGLVLDAGGSPVDEAFVVLHDPAGRLVARVTTGIDGRFVLEDLDPGDYQLTVRAAGHPPLAPVAVTIPSPVNGPIQLQLV